MFALSNVAYVTYEDAAHVVAEPFSDTQAG